MSRLFEDIAIVIRSVGERTEPHCTGLLQECFGHNDITIIRTRPFVKAMEETYKIGLAKDKKWTLCIDADILISVNNISKLCEIAENSPEELFEIQGDVLDKFFGGFKPAGNHLYRTKYMKKALEFTPEVTDSFRPETSVIKLMEKAGFSWKQSDLVVGLHDYHQYYQDIFRKGFFQGYKHGKYENFFRKFWKKGMKNDLDYKMALEGFKFSLEYGSTPIIDNIDFSGEMDLLFRKFNLSEKSAMLPDEISSEEIEKMITNHIVSKEYKIFEEIRANTYKKSFFSKMLNKW